MINIKLSQIGFVLHLYGNNKPYHDYSRKKESTPFWEILLEELTDKLANIQQEKSDNSIGQNLQGMQVCKEYMNLLQENVLQYGFSSQSEEIFFFKQIKPKFYCQLIFYHRLYNIEVGRPVGSMDDVKLYIEKQLNQIRHFFEENKFWYQYYRSSETYLDEKLFLRNGQSIPLSMRMYDINANPSFSTSFDYIFSRIQANELLAGYLQNTLRAGTNEKQQTVSAISSLQPLTWTDSKSALIEFAYAAKAKGVFNYGKATQKEIFDYLQQVFNIHLSNTSRNFQEILRRKTGYCNWLDSLRESYLKYIDFLENKDRG